MPGLARVELPGDPAGDLPGAEARGQDQPDLIGARPFRRGERREGGHGERIAGVGWLASQGRACRRGGVLELGEVGEIGLPPVAPDRHLGVPGALADCSLPRRDPRGEGEGARAQLIHRDTVEVGPGIDIHVAREEIEAGGRRDDLEGRDEREVGDRAVAGDEVDHIGTGGDLAGDTLQVVAGAIHEVVAGSQRPLAVLDHVVEAHVGVLFRRRADRFQGDIVESRENCCRRTDSLPPCARARRPAP